MMIRKATRHDIPALVEMMRRYAQEAPIQALQRDAAHDPAHVSRLLFQIVSGRGFVFIDDKLRGFIAAIVLRNVWCPSVVELRELAWWVDPEHRNKTLGGKLWIHFDCEAQTMLNEKRIGYVCTTRMNNSPAIDYTKRNYALLETTFFKE